MECYFASWFSCPLLPLERLELKWSIVASEDDAEVSRGVANVYLLMLLLLLSFLVVVVHLNS